MVVAITFSPNWSYYVAVEMYSLFKNNDTNIKVYLISDELLEDDLYRFDSICSKFGDKYIYEYVNALDLYNKLIPSDINVTSRFSKYTLYRLLLSQIVKEDEVIYIDADALVCNSIIELDKLNMGNNYVLGVTDSGINDEYKLKYFMCSHHNYCNAGILKINLKKIREEKIDKDWTYLVNNKKFDNNDQDIIMMTCKGHVGLIDLKFNVSQSTGLDIKKELICVCHYAGIKSEGSQWVKSLPFSDIWDTWEQKYKDEFSHYIYNPKIPKRIFYCWFGYGEKPEKIKNCIQSWKNNCPDYEIIEINEENTDVNCNKFVSEAYKNKKYAFLNDYFRMKFMYEKGGITLDADVEVIKPLDEFLRHRFFTGKEVDHLLICATMGSEKGHPLPRFIMNFYEMAVFNVNNMQPNTEIITKLISSFIKSKTNEKVLLENDVNIYNQEVFAPYDHCNKKPIPTDNTYTIHHFQGSWLKE